MTTEETKPNGTAVTALAEAQALIRKERDARVARARAAIQAALELEGCRLVAFVPVRLPTGQDGQVPAHIVVEAMDQAPDVGEEDSQS
jgi:hypothetical protein